jgi:GNAT superfamily N-acetyltransferase
MARESQMERRLAEPNFVVEAAPPGPSRELSALAEKVLADELRVLPDRSLRSLLEKMEKRKGTEHDVVLLARAGQETAGGLILTIDDSLPSRTGLISLWAVDAAFRGRGVGRELLRAAISLARQKGLLHLRARTLAFLPGPVRLLWSHGFKVVGQQALPGDSPRELLLFERPLGPGDEPI